MVVDCVTRLLRGGRHALRGCPHLARSRGQGIERRANATLEIIGHLPQQALLLRLRLVLQLVLLAAQPRRFGHVVSEDLHRLRHRADLVASCLRRDRCLHVTLGKPPHRRGHASDRAQDAAAEQEGHADDEQRRERDERADPPSLGPEDRVDVVDVDAAGDRPAKGLELDGVGQLRQGFADAAAREAIGDEAAALGGRRDLIAAEIDAVRILDVAHVLAFDLRVRVGHHDALFVEREEIVVLTEMQLADHGLAASHRLGFREPRLLRDLVVELDGLESEEDDLLQLRLAVLQEIVAERREPDGRDRGDAEYSKDDHDYKLGGDAQTAEHKTSLLKKGRPGIRATAIGRVD
jgi:hypothetical protein